jgi:hypothetical protein
MVYPFTTSKINLQCESIRALALSAGASSAVVKLSAWMASAEVSGHRSLNLLKFCELAPGVYEGPQGVDLRDFVEF